MQNLLLLQKIPGHNLHRIGFWQINHCLLNWTGCFVRNLARYIARRFLYLFCYPYLYSYTKVDLPIRMFGAWAAVTINSRLNPEEGIGLHRDAHDFWDGLCWTIPYGDFTSGSLNFSELNIELDYAFGDVAAFQSLQLHRVRKFTSIRYFLILFSHNTLFKPCKNSK